MWTTLVARVLVVLAVVSLVAGQAASPGADCSGLDNCSGRGRCVHSNKVGGLVCECNHGFSGNKCKIGPVLLEQNVDTPGSVAGLLTTDYQIADFQEGDIVGIKLGTTGSVEVYFGIGRVPNISANMTSFDFTLPGDQLEKKLVASDLEPSDPSLPSTPLFISVYNPVAGSNADFTVFHTAERDHGLFGLGDAGIGVLIAVILCPLCVGGAAVAFFVIRRRKSKEGGNGSDAGQGNYGANQGQGAWGTTATQQPYGNQQQGYGGGSWNGTPSGADPSWGGSMNGMQAGWGGSVGAQQNWGGSMGPGGQQHQMW